MNRIKSGLASAALTLGLALSATASGAETLGAALTSAYNTSGLLEQNRALLRAADESVAQALSALRPVVQWSASANQRFTESASAASGFASVSAEPASVSLELSASLLLYDFGASQVGIDIAKESVLSTRYSLIGVEQQVLLRAAAAFFQVQRASEFVSVRESNLRLIRQELRAAQDRFEVGEVTRTDVSLAEARLAAAQSALSAAQGGLNQARIEYVAAVGREPSNLQTPASLPALPPTVQAAMAAAAVNHPSVLAAQKDVKVSELNVVAADLALRPSINLSTSYGVTEDLNDSGSSRGLTIGVGASQTIYAGGRLSSLQRQAMQRRDATRSNLHVVVDNVRSDAGNAYSNVLVARASRDAGTQQVRAAQVAFDGVREETSLGARTTLDVLNAQQDLLQARVDLISARIDEYVGAYQLLAATGQLTAEKLGLPVQIYDPAAYYNLVKDAPAGLSKRGQQLDKVLRRIGKQ
ncbi:TolC family outer membrane protein [Pseudooceanicola sp.]|uniref:TolC family outer membrane protein n=1 Tax=Pseudooceanicola sp. TaxID=1914328 RepID=UPI00351168CD